MAKKLLPGDLSWSFDNDQLIKKCFIKGKQSKSKNSHALSQKRALNALELGLGIKQKGYNIFVVGNPGTGRTSTVNYLLSKRAGKEQSPNDLVLLYNFEDSNRPLSVNIPSGSAVKLKKMYEGLVGKVITTIERTFEAEAYISQKQNYNESCRVKTEQILINVEKEAESYGFTLSRASGSLTLSPADKEGNSLSEKDFNKLPSKQRKALESNAEFLESKLEDALRKVRVVEKDADDNIELLAQKTAQKVLSPLFESAKQQWKGQKRIITHLDDIFEDILLRLHRFIPHHQMPEEAENAQQHLSMQNPMKDDDEDFDQDEPLLLRYKVNILVDNAKLSGAPVIYETHPTASNLIGRIEQRVRQGETVSEFTRIQAGALYKANGGYLILEAQDLLRETNAWEGLKRALKNLVIELDDPGEPGRMVSVTSIRPEPVPLCTKVILIGTPDIYYHLAKIDHDFVKLFKVKADFEIEVDRTNERISDYLQFLDSICQEEKLNRLNISGAKRVLEYCVRLSGHQKRITTCLGDVIDLVREANYWSKKSKAKSISIVHINKALQEKSLREGYIEIRMLEEMHENRVIIETKGYTVGQCNALTVVDLGNYEFGTPLRVTCRVGCGRGEIIDIERETKLGGPLHTKGTMIIKGLLLHLFGRYVPLGLTATLCMEQTYSEVDGDSASLAEACALFSSIAGAPINQSIALTGSIDQRGQIQAVGGINEKIEGFYKLVCKDKGNELRGVIIPESNKLDLVLHEDVVQACQKGIFNIWTVKTFEETMQLLTGQSWNKGKNNLQESILATLQHLQNMRNAKSDDHNFITTYKKESARAANFFTDQ